LKKLLKNMESSQKSDSSGSVGQDTQLRDLRQQLKDIDFNISRLKNERQKIGKQIDKYEGWIAAAPVREAEWAALTRDYDQLNAHYQGLVTQGLQAESAISLEKQLQGSQFKIVDNAHFPEKPLKPDFKKIFLLAIILGLGVGGGLAYGIEMMGTSFKDPAEMEAYLNVPVVCALPIVLTEREIAKRKTLSIAGTSLLLVFGSTVIGAIIYFWNKGMIII
jgi:polysaccharide biosynthesis transport protein